MCQGHEDAAPPEQPKVSSSTSAGQPQKKKKKKFQKLQLKPPPAEPPRPAHEIVNTGSTRIANGVPYVDTHCHTFMTINMYREKATAKDPAVVDIPAFINEFFPPECASIVDVHCDPPFQGWKQLAERAGEMPLKYYFSMGCHPHNAKRYNDSVEKIILEAMQHPKCVAWGEMGLDYHYNHSPHDVQQRVLIRQLKHAISLNKPLVIHTREADTDIFKILTENVPRETRMHIHCFTDAPSLAASILSHFPNSFIGITGVITYASNLNTTEIVKATPLERLLLETDSPFMIPNNVQKGIKSMGGKSTRLPVCWSGMIPYTAEYVADIKGVSAEKVLEITRENALRMYGIEI